MTVLESLQAEMAREYHRQHKEHPQDGDNEFHNLSILAEEVGEAAKAANDANVAARNDHGELWAEHTAHLREELIQIGAYVLRMVRELDERTGW